jgi:hypothetical protein
MAMEQRARIHEESGGRNPRLSSTATEHRHPDDRVALIFSRFTLISRTVDHRAP